MQVLTNPSLSRMFAYNISRFQVLYGNSVEHDQRAECNALAACNDATRRNVIQRAERRPVYCKYCIPPFKFKSFITDLMNLRTVLCKQ